MFRFIIWFTQNSKTIRFIRNQNNLETKKSRELKTVYVVFCLHLSNFHKMFMKKDP